jgi:hypothetical protein
MQLPYVPLHVVLFPHLPLPLHIFEERYRAMTEEIVATGSPYAGRFVVSMITEGAETGDDPHRMARAQPVGTIAEVRSADRLADGRWVLLAVGVTRVRLGAIDRTGRYAIVEVEPLPEVDGNPADAARLLGLVRVALDAYLTTVKRFVAATASMGREQQENAGVTATLDQVLKPIALPDDPLAASYAVAGVLQVELTRKQQLLEAPDAATRLQAELELLRRETRLLADRAMPPVSSGDLRYNPN